MDEEQRKRRNEKRRANYKAKKDGVFKDQRKKEFKATPKIIDNVKIEKERIEALQLKMGPMKTYVNAANNWKMFIHHISRKPQVNHIIKTLCGPLEKDPQDPDHVHYLRIPTEEEKRLQKTGHLARERKKKNPKEHGLRDCRIKINCIGHFINVTHYLRCPRASTKHHVHKDFKTVYDTLPLCEGKSWRDCDVYRKTLRKLVDCEWHTVDNCHFCCATANRFKANGDKIKPKIHINVKDPYDIVMAKIANDLPINF